ncbi:hypothetical protein Plhal304r1_c001g0001611 [Plasmopara halstedii]
MYRDGKIDLSYWFYSKPEKLLEIFEKQLGSNDLVSLFQGVLNDIELERLFKAALKNDDQERCSEIL